LGPTVLSVDFFLALLVVVVLGFAAVFELEVDESFTETGMIRGGTIG